VEKRRTKTRRASRENDHDDDHVTTATDGDLVLLHDFESVNLVSNESM